MRGSRAATLSPPVDIAALRIYAAWPLNRLASPSSTVQISTMRVFFDSVATSLPQGFIERESRFVRVFQHSQEN